MGYPKSAQGVGVGLQVVSVAIGTNQLRNQIKNRKKIDLLNVAQVVVGSTGLGASFLNFLGIGGRVTLSIGANAGVIGLILSIPGNWSVIYQGANDMQFQLMIISSKPQDIIRAILKFLANNNLSWCEIILFDLGGSYCEGEK